MICRKPTRPGRSRELSEIDSTKEVHRRQNWGYSGGIEPLSEYGGVESGKTKVQLELKLVRNVESNIILFLAGMELIFFIAVDMVVCF